MELIVNDGAPNIAALISPADAEVGEAINPSFSWDGVVGASDYLLEVATDAAFANIVISEMTTETTLVPSQSLTQSTEYFWRVTASNTCGSGVASDVFTFTTTDEICFIGNTNIPDDDATGLDITINIPDSGTLENVLVEVGAEHTWVGDLIFTLTHGGTSVELANRVGVILPSDFGCNANNVDVIFDDSSDTPVQTSCVDGTDPGISGTVQPLQPLSGFVGQDASGDWTLNVSDNAFVDVGTMTKFCVFPVFGSNDVIFTNGFE